MSYSYFVGVFANAFIIKLPQFCYICSSIVSFNAIENMQCVLLAAGASRRLGSPKQLVQLGAETLIVATAQKALQVADSLLIVLGANADSIEPVLDTLPHKKRWQVARNQHWAEGMASSLRLATQEALAQKSEGLLLLVCDQPFLSVNVLAEICSRINDTSLVVSEYTNGQIGVPMYVPKRYFADLLEIRGDVGAKVLLKKYPEVLVKIPFDRGEIDIDTPEDIQRI